MKNAVIESLAGTFLLSTPQMPDPRFSEQVIYICSHGPDGAIGLTVNKPNLDIDLKEVLLANNLPVPENLYAPVYTGGPVEQNSAFILYQSDYKAKQKLQVTSTVHLSRSTQVLEDIANGCGPSKFIFTVGYAGWGPGQLEGELISQGWLTLPGQDAIIFDTPDKDKWRQAAAIYGVDIATYHDVIGNA